MFTDSESKGLLVTAGADKRITKVGECLRKYKIDELPQLIDVLVGNMSIVGPRPEVPRYMACYPYEIRRLVLSVRPGITDNASIEYRDENFILGAAADPDRFYVDEILPKKQNFYLDYVRSRTFIGDIGIVFRTLLKITR
jgi:lipopolysaccharide/colanic/teichoic acid biosynthesis glycosyltransferase